MFYLLYYFTFGSQQSQVQFIQIRGFSSPPFRRSYRCRHTSQFMGTTLRIPFVHPARFMFQVEYIFHIPFQCRDFSSGSIFQYSLQGSSFSGHPSVNAELRIYLQDEILIVRRNRKSPHCIITDTDIGCVQQMDAAVDTTKTPEVLIFKIRAVTIPVNLQCDLILSGMQVVCNIEFTRFHTSLAIPYPFSIYPDIESTHHSFKAQKSLSVRFPSHRQNECAPILSDRVSFFIGRIVSFRLSHYSRRIYLKRITCRYINRCAISVDFPIGRNRKVLPVFIIKVCLIEIYDSFARNRSPSELPCSVQRHRTVSFLYGERSKSSPCRFTINLENMMILPVMHCLCLHRASDQCAKQ